MTTKPRVVIVDDSAYVRKVFREMLTGSARVEVVGIARDGEEALNVVEELRPDVVTCDLLMPAMDGVEFVRRQMARRPVPIIISSVIDQAAGQVIAALEAGAVDFVQKPTARASEDLLSMRDELVEKVTLAARARVASRTGGLASAAVRPIERRHPAVDVVVIGASTGGPQAIREILSRLPADCPVPIALVIHMPAGFTEMYARRLDEMCALTVIEARGREAVRAGTVYVAPAGWHLLFARDAGGVVRTQLDTLPIDTPHRPAVDVLFKSAAEAFGEHVLGVVLTGMGADGRAGAAWIKARGGHILTEDETTCVVYGMPRSVVEAGLSDQAVPVDRMAEQIMEWV